MSRLLWALVLGAAMASPALAQKKQAAPVADPCAPIGKTSDGRMVYSLKCDAIPVAVVPPLAAPVAIAPPPEEEEDKGGLFRNPIPSIIRPTNVQRSPGVGPPGGGR